MLIKIKNTRKQSFSAKHGVLQGSPVSTDLFIIYVPQPENVQTSTQSQFADDIPL